LRTGSTFANLAEADQGLNNPEHAARFLTHAETAYATILKFMFDPKHGVHITPEEHAELSAGLEQLRTRLDNLARKPALDHRRKAV
jgi:hypothetical protein